MTTILDATTVKADLKLTSTSDTAITSAIAATTELIESQSLCGPFDSQTYTETLHACGNIILTRGPVLDLTSVAGEIYGSVDTSLLAVNPAGIVRPKRMQVLLFDDYYTVEYTYGRTDAVPDAVIQAALVIFKSVLAVLRGSNTRPNTGGTETSSVPGFPYPVPTLALQLLEPYLLGPTVG